MHGPFLPASTMIWGLLAGQLLVLAAFAQMYLVKQAHYRGPAKLVLDGLALLSGAVGIVFVLVFAAASAVFGAAPARVHALFAVLALVAAVVAFLGHVAARRESGHAPVSIGQVVSILAGGASAIAHTIAFAAAAATWAVA